MKIDSNRANLETTPSDRIDATRMGDTKSSGARAAQRGTDQVSVSDAAKFASSAIDAARNAPDVRPDVVERAKALVNAGTVGRDPYKLADALIDKALEAND
jgi:flagellar biosynthesis anti-sigma factor FlgM